MNTELPLDFSGDESKKAPEPEKTPTINQVEKTYKDTPVDKFKENKAICLDDVKTQVDAVLYHIQQEGMITSWDGFKEWGITRMSAIIHKIRHTHHIDIESEDVITENRFKHSTRYSKYKLKKI